MRGHSVVTALVLSVLVACGGGGGGGGVGAGSVSAGDISSGIGAAGPAGTGATADAADPMVTVGTEKAAPLQATDAAALTAWLRDRLAARTADGGGDTYWMFGRPAEAPPLPTYAAMVPTSPPSSTAGADEGDRLLVDGSQVYALAPHTPGLAQNLVVRTASSDGTLLTPQPNVPLPEGFTYDRLLRPAGLDRLVATGLADAAIPAPAPDDAGDGTVRAVRSPLRSSVRILDVADRARPQGGTTLTLDGRIHAAQPVDRRLWLVVLSEPRFDGFDTSGSTVGQARNQRFVDALSASDLLPLMRRDDGPWVPLVTPQACFVPTDSPGGLGAIVTLVSIDLADPALARRARCVVGRMQAIRLSRDSLVLATLRQPCQQDGPRRRYVASEAVVTDVHKFALRDDAIVPRGSARVLGQLAWSLNDTPEVISESEADLRVLTSGSGPAATATGDAPPQSQAVPPGGAGTPAAKSSPVPTVGIADRPARLTVLRDTGDGLTTIATLPNARRPEAIGPAWRVHVVGARVYVGSAGNPDRLRVIDLGDPADPKLVGTVSMPGCGRLLPLSDTLVLDIGHRSCGLFPDSVRVSLHDVTVPDAVVTRATREIGGVFSQTALDLSRQGAMLRRVGDRVRVAVPLLRVGDPGTTDPLLAPRALEAWRFLIDPATGSWTEAAPIVVAGPGLVDDGRGAITGKIDVSGQRAFDLGSTGWFHADGRFASSPW